mgnify:CR=1 FL=1|jgi:hypothetical protein
MKDMKNHQSEEEKANQLKMTINSEPYFSFSVRPSKINDLSAQKEKPKDDIKLFDFGSAEIKESFVNNADSGEPLQSHKIYLNIVYHDRIIPPLNKDRDFANPKDDKTWQIIPIAFTDPVTRKSPSGEVLTYDGHINTCVMTKMKES